MKALLSIFALAVALLVGSAGAQTQWSPMVPNAGGPLVPIGHSGSSGGGTCSAAVVVVARLTGGASNANAAAISTFICGLIADGGGCSAWSGSSGNLDFIHVYAQTDTNSAIQNLCSALFNASIVNGTTPPAFTANAGWNNTQSGGYVVSGFNPVTAAGNYTQNAASLGICTLETGGTTAGYKLDTIENGNTSPNIAFFAKDASGNLFARVNETTGAGVANAGNTSTFIGGNRSGASAEQWYQNGTLVASPNATSTALQNNTIVLAAGNPGSGIVGEYNGLIMADLGGGSMTAAQWASFNTRLQQLVTTIHGSSCGGAGPTVTTLTPNSGTAAGGTPVVLTGMNFTGVTSVSFGGVSVAFTYVNTTTIDVTSPGGTGAVNVTVTTAYGTSPTGAGNQYTYTGGGCTPDGTTNWSNACNLPMGVALGVL